MRGVHEICVLRISQLHELVGDRRELPFEVADYRAIVTDVLDHLDDVGDPVCLKLLLHFHEVEDGAAEALC